MRVNRETFLRNLETARPGLSPRDIVEQSTCYIFRDGVITTFNDEVACTCPSGLDEDFSGAVPSKPLLAILQKLEEEEIDISVADTELVIKGKNRKVGIRLEQEIVLPFDSVEQPDKWQSLHPEFLQAIDVVHHCAGKDETQFEMTCVHIHPKWIEACDNFQMTRYMIKTGIKQPTLVRKEAIRHIIALGVTEFAETDTWIHFRNGELVMSCRRYLEEYKDYGKLLKVNGQPAALPKGLAEAADRAEIFSSENVDDNLVKIYLFPGKVRIKGQGVTGWYQETKKIQYQGEPMNFLISPKLLQELTRKHNSCSISQDYLKVEGEKWTYVTVLGREEE